MHIAYLAVSAVIVGATAWVLIASMRKPIEIDEMVNQVEATLANRLYPFMELKHHNWEDDDLWWAIGGTKGVHEMRGIAGLWMMIAIVLRHKYPKEAKEMFCSALYLWILTWSCLWENQIKRFAPLPRVRARSCARLYCDISATLEVVMSDLRI